MGYIGVFRNTSFEGNSGNGDRKTMIHYSGSSSTRYRVVAPTGLIGSFRHLDDAEAFAELKSKSGGCMVVFDRPYASKGKMEAVASYLGGVRHPSAGYADPLYDVLHGGEVG